MSDRIYQALMQAYHEGRRGAYDHAAKVATHRYFLSLMLAPEARKAVFEALPNEIRALARPSAEAAGQDRGR